MTIYDHIFSLAKKTAKALSKGEEPVDLHASNVFDEENKKHLLEALREEAVEYNVKQLQSIDTQKDWEKVALKLKPKRKPLLAPFYKVAAVVIILISVGFVAHIILNKKEHRALEGPQIIAGTDKAILTLEDGSQVALQKGIPFQNELVTSNGERLDYERGQTKFNTAFNYLTVPRGGKYQIALSDGTEVWLNAATKLKYPVTFKPGETRVVELLYGEAYFDVSPSTKHQGSRFKVATKGQEVVVLGTEFNIKAYEGENEVFTTLVEGKVDVKVNEHSESLSPGEQTVMHVLSREVVKKTVDIKYDIAWVKGYFNFKDKPLKEIMKVLSRWYDVEIYFESNDLEQVKFSGLLNRNQHIEDILNGIQNTNIINAYEIKNKTVTIK